MTKRTENVNIVAIQALPSPGEIKTTVPSNDKADQLVFESRQVIQNILSGKDKRQLLVVGPCSIHDPEAAYDYAKKLVTLHQELSDKLYIIMRVYFEKPRTTLGWKGLINDPDLDESYNIEKGFRLARKVLLTILDMGLPTGSEMLDTLNPQYISDLVCWGSLGARTTESQPHREMSSGLSMPIGFKNATTGDPKAAIHAVEVAKHPHSFLGVDQDGKIAIVKTKGNPYGHLILRGGDNSPNFDPITIGECAKILETAGLCSKILIDCSHGNSRKKHINQVKVFKNILSQIKEGNSPIFGAMLESNLVEGNQKIASDLSQLTYGQSVTDECIGWDTTEALLRLAHRSI
jgi:3-deoxy-7-phosphoheptulonate synthase